MDAGPRYNVARSAQGGSAAFAADPRARRRNPELQVVLERSEETLKNWEVLLLTFEMQTLGMRGITREMWELETVLLHRLKGNSRLCFDTVCNIRPCLCAPAG